MTRLPVYRDAQSVLAGLDRLREDVAALPAELEGLSAVIRPLVGAPFPAVRQRANDALIHQQVQFAWLSTEFMAMRGALGSTCIKENSMPASKDADPLTRLYLAAEALRFLERILPEEHGGLGLLLAQLACEIDLQTSHLDNAENA